MKHTLGLRRGWSQDRKWVRVFTWQRRGKGARSCHHPELRSALPSLFLFPSLTPNLQLTPRCVTTSINTSTAALAPHHPVVPTSPMTNPESEAPALVVFVAIFLRAIPTLSNGRHLVVKLPYTHTFQLCSFTSLFVVA